MTRCVAHKMFAAASREVIYKPQVTVIFYIAKETEKREKLAASLTSFKCRKPRSQKFTNEFSDCEDNEVLLANSW